MVDFAKQRQRLRLLSLSFGNIAGDLRRADNAPARGADGRNRYGDIERNAAFREPDGFIIFDLLPRDNLGENRVFFGLTVLGNNQTN